MTTIKTESNIPDKGTFFPGGVVVKGHIRYFADRNRWSVVWYDETTGKKQYVSKYNGHYIPCTQFKTDGGALVLDDNNRPVPDKAKCKGHELAVKLLGSMQTRAEQALRGECVFRIEEFTKTGWTDTVEYYNSWLEVYVKSRKKPGTLKAYQSYGRTWIEPFFEKHPVRLHEIEYDLLLKFQQFIIDGLRKNNPTGNVDKTALNILSAFKKMLKFAKKSKRIPYVPPFPELEDYDLKQPEIDYFTRDEYEAAFARIPSVHQPIFKFLSLHYRRPGEACALHKIDYDPFNDGFTIRRALSARKVVNSVKTNWKKPKVHNVPCDPEFSPIAKRLFAENPESPFLFVNPRARKDGKRYTLEALRNVWYKACDDAGVRRIWTYRGVKHTSCTNFLEEGGTLDELQILTDHASRKSVEQYAAITLDKKRATQEAARDREKKAAVIRKVENDRRGQAGDNVIKLADFSK